VAHLNHAVTLIGYGIDPDTSNEYFILRNQWNASWGEKGYMRILIDSSENGQAGMNHSPVIPFVEGDFASGGAAYLTVGVAAISLILAAF